MILLFAGYNYYPSGGWSDFVDSFQTKEEALEKLLKINKDWWQMVDATTLRIIDEGFSS